jgi:Transposase DDE domain
MSRDDREQDGPTRRASKKGPVGEQPIESTKREHYCTKGFSGPVGFGILGRSERSALLVRPLAPPAGCPLANPRPSPSTASATGISTTTPWSAEARSPSGSIRTRSRRGDIRGRPSGGAQFESSDTAIECRLTLRSVYHLTLRATEGFASSLLELMLVDLPVPDYSTLGRRAATVHITLPRRAEGPMHLVLDSTGLKVYGEGELKVRLAVDQQTHEIQAAVVSEPGVADAEAVPSLLEQVEDPIERASGDGMDDRRAVYATSERRGARALIPPRRDAKIQRDGNTADHRRARDENLRRIRKVGRAAWKEESGYHRRSLAETAMFRVKTIFGPGVSSRKDGQRATEVGVRCRALNIVAHQGMPWTVRVA